MDDETREQLALIAAETFALQTLFVVLMNWLKHRDPTVTKVFDEAAEIIENLALGRAQHARHLPQAIKVIEELRSGVTRNREPKHGV